MVEDVDSKTGDARSFSKLSQGMIRFASFSSVQNQESLLSAILKSHVIIWPNMIGWLHLRFAATREWAHLANAGDFNRRYPTCQISAILCTDRSDRRKSQSLHRAHLAIIADRRDRRIKSPSVSPALVRGIQDNGQGKKGGVSLMEWW